MLLFEEAGISPVELLDELGVLVHIMTADGSILQANSHWTTRLGYSLAALPELNFIHQIVHSLYRPSVADAIHDALLSGHSLRGLRVIVCGQDQRETEFEATLIPRSHHTGMKIIVCMLRDVPLQPKGQHSQTILAQDLLWSARDQFQTILDNSGIVVAIKDLAGQYILVNQEFADRLGYPNPRGLVGKRDEELFPIETAIRLSANDQMVMGSGSAMQFEEMLLTGDHPQIFLTTRFLLRDQHNQPYAICMIAKDITYRKITEMQLLLRNQAIEYSPSGISIADARLPDMPLIYINPAFEQNTGYSALDVIGRNCRFLQGDDRDQEGIRVIREAIEAEQPCLVVLRNYKKDGSLFYNELSLAPIHNEDGELTHYVGISTDVTDRIVSAEKIQAQNHALLQTNKELARARQEAISAAERIKEQNEQLLHANHELAVARRAAEDATRLKSQFLATMSHELRTPLNAIIGYTEIQLAGMTGDLGEEQRDYQVRVLANAEHLLELINDVLDLAKIEAGRLEIVSKPFQLRAWMQDVVDQTGVLAKEKGLQFDVSFDARMPEYIVGDAARLRQVAVNLLSNAIKFTHQGGVRLQIRKHGSDAWMLIIEDTGIGIPSHLQETVFEEFRQVDSSSQRKAGGTGLGLSIVRKLALMMGGTLRLKSQIGEGSIFTVILPLIDAMGGQYKEEEE